MCSPTPAIGCWHYNDHGNDDGDDGDGGGGDGGGSEYESGLSFCSNYVQKLS